MRLQHPIFRGPLKPGIELTDRKTPEGYLKYPGGKDLGATLKVWKVHEGVFPEVDVGLVSSPWGFEDSPDAEVISGGINSKGPRSVALGRHGNFFLWGFFGDPSMMTPSARRVFVNTVHYMRAFDGHKPLVRRNSTSRERAFATAAFMKAYPGYRTGTFDEKIREATHLDPDRLMAFLEENVEYLHHADGVFRIDEDARRLGVSTRKVEMLDAIAGRLRADAKDPLALGLIRRYVRPEGFESVAALETWLKENRSCLFFSDSGGYRWFVDVHATRARKPSPAAVPVSRRF